MGGANHFPLGKYLSLPSKQCKYFHLAWTREQKQKQSAGQPGRLRQNGDNSWATTMHAQNLMFDSDNC
jgi:hypothetical protein